MKYPGYCLCASAPLRLCVKTCLHNFGLRLSNSTGCSRFAGGEAVVGAGDFLGDGPIDLVLEVVGRDAEGAGDGAFARGAMGLEHRTFEAEQGRAAMDFRVHPAANGAKSVL